MNKLLVLFFGVLTLVNATENPFDPVAKLYENKGTPTNDQLKEALVKSDAILKKILQNTIVELSDINADIVGKCGHELELLFTKGKVTGVDSIYRSNDFTVTTENNLVRFKLRYGYENITINYAYEAKYKDKISKGAFTVEDTGFSYYIYLQLDLNTMKVSLENFEVERTASSPVFTVHKDANMPPDDLLIARILQEDIPDLGVLIEENFADAIKTIVEDLIYEYNSNVPTEKTLNIKLNLNVK